MANEEDNINEESTTFVRSCDTFHIHTKVYKKRWIILALSILFAAVQCAQFVQNSILTNVLCRYYNVSPLAINSIGALYMFAYVITVLPANYFVHKLDFRWYTILANVIHVLASWTKIYSVSPDRFYVSFIGSCLGATTQVYVMSAPGIVAAEWFPSSEVSIATSLCILGGTSGIGLGYLIMPMVVKNHENISDIGTDLFRMSLVLAIISTFSMAMALLFFEAAPEIPPSVTKALQRMNVNEKDRDNFGQILKRLLSNKTYIALCHTHGINIGITDAFSVFLNQFVIARFQNSEEDAGRIGFICVATGIIGLVTIGLVLSKTQKYKLTTVAVYFINFSAYTCFAISLLVGTKWMVYATTIFLGYFMTSYIVLGYEMCAEFTYPEPESISNSILRIVNNFYGIIFILTMGKLFEEYGDLIVHVVLCSLLFLGFVSTVLTKDVHKRQDARLAAANKSIPEAEKKILQNNNDYKL